MGLEHKGGKGAAPAAVDPWAVDPWGADPWGAKGKGKALYDGGSASSSKGMKGDPYGYAYYAKGGYGDPWADAAYAPAKGYAKGAADAYAAYPTKGAVPEKGGYWVYEGGDSWACKGKGAKAAAEEWAAPAPAKGLK